MTRARVESEPLVFGAFRGRAWRFHVPAHGPNLPAVAGTAATWRQAMDTVCTVLRARRGQRADIAEHRHTALRVRANGVPL